jgi:nitronate monooxygenase
MWQDKRICELLGIEHPIIQAPMAGATTPEMAAAAANAGALGSLGCAMFAPERIKQEAQRTKALTNRSINLNFFVHASPVQNNEKENAARANLAPWYDKMAAGDVPDAIEGHFPFNDAACEAVLEASP